VDAVEHLMGGIVRLMLGRAPAASEENFSGGKGTTVEATKISCIKTIKEYIVFCHRLKVLPQHLEDVEVGSSWTFWRPLRCLLLKHVTVPASPRSASSSTWTYRYRLKVSCVISNARELCRIQMRITLIMHLFSPDIQKTINESETILDKRTGPSDGGKQAGASELALSTLRCFNPFLQDISIVYRVLQTLLRYLDKDSRWEKEQLVEVQDKATGDLIHLLC